MKYKVRLLPTAARDINDLAVILSPYPQKAARLFQEMHRRLLQLEDNPFICPVYHANPNYRRMNLEDHALFYKVDEAKHEVMVYHVYYAKRDIPKLLED